MSKYKSPTALLSAAAKQIINQPVLIMFGVVAAIGGIINVSFIFIDYCVRAILLADGLQIVGSRFWQHIIAIVVGTLLSFLVILTISGFAQGLLLKIAAAHFHEEEDPWYGALRRGFDSMWPLAVIWLLFYAISTLFIFGAYRLTVLTTSATSSFVGTTVILIVILIIILFLLAIFAAIAMNASCFVSIFRLKTGAALANGFDLFVQIPLSSVGFMALICLVWLISCALATIAYAALLFIVFWVAHLMVSPAHLSQFFSSGSGLGLLSFILLVILFVTNAIFTTFGDMAWALFFLEYVSTLQLPKKTIENRMNLQSVLSEIETV